MYVEVSHNARDDGKSESQRDKLRARSNSLRADRIIYKGLSIIFRLLPPSPSPRPVTEYKVIYHSRLRNYSTRARRNLLFPIKHRRRLLYYPTCARAWLFARYAWPSHACDVTPACRSRLTGTGRETERENNYRSSFRYSGLIGPYPRIRR